MDLADGGIGDRKTNEDSRPFPDWSSDGRHSRPLHADPVPPVI